MICVEWWCFEAIILLAGRLPHPEVAIDIVGICVNVATTTFMLPFGLSGQLMALNHAAGCQVGIMCVQDSRDTLSHTL